MHHMGTHTFRPWHGESVPHGSEQHEIFPRASSRPSTQQVCLGTMSQILKGQASHKSVPIHIEADTTDDSVFGTMIQFVMVQSSYVRIRSY